jgi:hypothetical protein
MTRVAALAPQRTAPPGVVEGTPEQRPELASVSGKVVGPAGPRARVLLFLKGVPGASVEDEAHSLRSDRNGHYRFDNVKPGEYMLTDAVAGPVTWRVRVPLARAERRVLDLSPANHAAVRDDFPDYRR